MLYLWFNLCWGYSHFLVVSSVKLSLKHFSSSSGLVSTVMSGICIQIFCIRNSTQALPISQRRLCCLGWSPLTWRSQWINNSFARKQSVCVRACKWVQHFMDLLRTLRRAALISYLLEVCLNLQSSQANNEKVLKFSWNTGCMLYLNIMYRPSSREYRARKNWNQGDGFSCDRENVGLFFVPFECIQHAHLMHLCGLYPWTIRLAMYNMEASVMVLLHFKKEERLCIPE